LFFFGVRRFTAAFFGFLFVNVGLQTKAGPEEKEKKAAAKRRTPKKNNDPGRVRSAVRHLAHREYPVDFAPSGLISGFFCQTRSDFPVCWV
jgi:hypothetical protein